MFAPKLDLVAYCFHLGCQRRITLSLYENKSLFSSMSEAIRNGDYTMDSIGFLSYSRAADNHDDGQIVALAQRLAAEIEILSGNPFELFIDTDGIKWGDEWRTRIDDFLRKSQFFFPVITPSFLNSKFCNYECESFSKIKGKSGFIFPIYYLDCARVKDASSKALLDQLLSYQYLDWREQRFEPLNSAHVRKKVSMSADQICDLIIDRFGEVLQPSEIQEDDLRSEESESKAVATSETRVIAKASSVLPAKTQNPEIYVYSAEDDRYNGSIQDAIDKCAPGSTIYVHPGYYEESLKLPNKAMEIIGIPDQNKLVVVSGNLRSAITAQGDFLRLSNISFKNSSSIEACCRLIQSKATIVNCNFTNEHGTGIDIASSTPHFDRIKVSNCGEFGVIYASESSGSLVNSDLVGNQFANLLIIEKSDPLVRSNNISKSEQSGIFCYNYGRGQIEENLISENAHAGLAVSDHGHPIARRNDISGNTHYGGIYVFSKGRGSFEQNRLYNNRTADFEVTRKCSEHVNFDQNDSRSKQSLIYRN